MLESLHDTSIQRTATPASRPVVAASEAEAPGPVARRLPHAEWRPLRTSHLTLAAGLWLLVTIAALASRPLLPVDETRYLAVAWEMWSSGDALVPRLNGEPYAHKGPLLFWLINAGWLLVGVNEWTARLTAPLFGLASVLMTARLARQLWPDLPHVRAAAPLILAGGGFWIVFSSLTYFDSLVTCFTLVGLSGILEIGRGRLLRGGLMATIAMACGLLTKGPVLLVHLAPVAICAPLLCGAFWGAPIDGRARSRGAWYATILVSLVAGALIALAWALPAAAAGGEDFARSILFGQSADRVVNSFAHPRPVWWYLVIIPPLLFPWVCWPALMRAAGACIRSAVRPASAAAVNGAAAADSGPATVLAEPGTRLCVIWVGGVVAALSLVSGKLPHYLMPTLPAFALLIARIIPLCEARVARYDRVPAAMLILIAGIAATALGIAGSAKAPEWLLRAALPGGLVLIIASISLLCVRTRATMSWVLSTTAIVSLMVAALHLAIAPALRDGYDLSPVAERISRFQQSGVHVGHLGRYHGEYTFRGRLQPLEIIEPYQLDAWAIAHPRGVIVGSYSGHPWQDMAWPEYRRSFRGKSTVALWSADEERYRALRQPDRGPEPTPREYRDLRRTVLSGSGDANSR